MLRAKFVSILIIALSLALTLLGVWQLQRAQQKQYLIQQQNIMAQQPATVIKMTEQLRQLTNNQNIQITGKLDNQHTFLLDNRFQQHRTGFEVLTPLYYQNTVILVNRGWIPRPMNRSQLPHIADIPTPYTITGQINYPQKQWLLKAEQFGDSWPKVIQRFDQALLQHYFNAPLKPFILRMDAEQTNGFIRQWPVTTISPARHIAYAVQWFALAILLLVLFKYTPRV